jgi:hypothetical protein
MARNNIRGNPEGQHSGSQGDGPKPGGSMRGKAPLQQKGRPTGNKGTKGGGGGRMPSSGGGTY